MPVKRMSNVTTVRRTGMALAEAAIEEDGCAFSHDYEPNAQSMSAAQGPRGRDLQVRLDMLLFRAKRVSRGDARAEA